MMTYEERCSQSVADGGRSISFHRCSRRGIQVHNGKKYCKQHYPPFVVQKGKEDRQKWEREWTIKQLGWKLIKAEREVLDKASKFHEALGSDGVLPSEWVASGEAQGLYAAVSKMKDIAASIQKKHKE